MSETVLSTHQKEEVVQYSLLKYQKEWQHEKPSACIFHLIEQTKWKTILDDEVIIRGCLLGGGIDSIRNLIGTPYGSVVEFREKHTDGEPVVWYLENCELTTTDLRRSLVQMKLAGWFDDCSGILFGRSSAS